MKKGESTGPQKRRSTELVPAQEATTARRDDSERRRSAYSAVRDRLYALSERLLEACDGLPEAQAAGIAGELPVQPLQALEKNLATLVVEAEQLRDTI